MKRGCKIVFLVMALGLALGSALVPLPLAAQAPSAPPAVTAPAAPAATPAPVVPTPVVASGHLPKDLSPWSMFMAAGYEKESSSGYERSVNVAGHPGFERWNKRDKDGELNLVVNKRFLVTIDGNNIEDNKVLEEFATKIDAAKLASFK